MRYVRTMSDTATIVYRDEFDPQYDFGHWTIRDDEVLPLHELLGSLLADASLTDAQQHLVDEMVRGLRSQGIKVGIKLVQFLKTYAQQQEG